MKLDWLNKFLEYMWPYLDKVIYIVWLFLEYYVFNLSLLLSSILYFLLMVHGFPFNFFVGNLQDCKRNCKAHNSWGNSKVQDWVCWIWNTDFRFLTTNFSRLVNLRFHFRVSLLKTPRLRIIGNFRSSFGSSLCSWVVRRIFLNNFFSIWG